MRSRMFQDMKKAHHAWSQMLNRGDERFVTMKPRTATVAARFQDSLQALLESMSKKKKLNRNLKIYIFTTALWKLCFVILTIWTGYFLSFVLHRCNPWFIRCLKPNRQRGETSHELGFARRPITLACWRRFALIRKNGYPVRMTFQRCLLTRRERRNLARSPNPPGLTIGRIQIGSDARGSR